MTSLREAIEADVMPIPARGSVSLRARNRLAKQRYLASPKGLAQLALRDERAKLHRLRLEEIKVTAGCMDCPVGTDWPPEALEFDHARSVKCFHVTQAAGRTWRQLVEEMAKCDVVCANHHAVRTGRRRASD